MAGSAGGSALRAVSEKTDSRLLPGARHGRAALTALGGALREAASRNSLSSARLTSILTEDKTAWLSATGRLFYVDTDARPADHPIAQDITPPTEPLANTFALHSNASSTHKMYLDFNGYTLPSGTDWTLNGFSSGAKKGFSIDADYATFSDTEKAYVQQVWRITAEKYSAFDIDVTTQDPGTAALNRSNSGDTTYGNRLVFTDDAAAKPASVCPSGCLGIAFVGTYNETDPSNDRTEPAWVYTSTLKDEPTYTANVAAHEAGHNLGLEHDGTNAEGDGSYYEGQGNWFPIMGASYLGVGQFSKGEYPDANNSQDDLAVIASFGAPVRADDEGSVASPIALGTTPTYTENGIIESDADVDVFTVTTQCVADLDVSAEGIGEGQALDIKLTVLSADGNTTLASADPASGQSTVNFPYAPIGVDATTSVTSAPIGTYRIQVEGVGGNEPFNTNYSGYGSIGQYHLTASGCATAGGVVPSAPLSSSVTALDRSTSATISWAPPTSAGTPGTITGYRISGMPAGTQDIPASPRSFVVTGLIPEQAYTVKVAAINATGAGPTTSIPILLKSWVPTTAPGMKIKVVKNKALIDYVEPLNPGHAAFTMWRVTINGQNFDDAYGAFSGIDISGFGNGTYTAKIMLFADADLGSVTPTYSKSFVVGATAPRIGAAISGAKRKPITAAIKWAVPVSLGGYPITGWKAIAYKLTKSGGIGKGYITAMLSPRARSFSGKLPAGRYKFRVIAYNALGSSPASAYSKAAIAR